MRPSAENTRSDDSSLRFRQSIDLRCRYPTPNHSTISGKQGFSNRNYIQGAVDGETVTYPVTGGSGTGNINKTVITVEKVDFGEPKPAKRVEMTPDVVAEMNQYLMEFYMAWIDRPLACLDDKTPREACETKSGKAKVAALIRGMGSPTTYGVKVPRQAMLRELGLQ
jgi:hypothetical protein